MSEDGFDIIVLGGGSGGYAAALRARELGRTVALVERDQVGGTCLHRGCVPTKALLHSGEVADVVRNAAHHGVSASFEAIDIAAVHDYRRKIVSKKHAGLTGLLAARGVATITGDGYLEADRRVRVGERVLSASDIVLATGGRTRELADVPLGGRVLSSDTALELDEVPSSVVILGGGVIGVEFASIWRSFGAEVTIIEPLPRLLPSEDEASSAALLRAFRKRGIAASFGLSCTGVDAGEDQVTVTLSDGSTRTADYALVAAGRIPATADLGFEDAGVELNAGFVVTDAELRTSAPHVWAVGDIVRGPQLAHRGFAHGIAVAERIAGLAVAPLADEVVPRVAYSSPEVASVGLTTAAAIERFGEDAVETAEIPLAANAKSEILGTSGFARVVRRREGPVLGVHLVGDRVGELITEGQLLVGWDAHPEDVAPLIHAHPTQSEALGEALLLLSGKPLHAI